MKNNRGILVIAGLLLIFAACFASATGGSTSPLVTFATPSNGSFVAQNTLAWFNATISSPSVLNMTWMWDGAKHSVLNDSLVLAYNFDNVSAIGDSASTAVEISHGVYNGTITGGDPRTNSGKYGAAMAFNTTTEITTTYPMLNLNTTDWTICWWYTHVGDTQLEHQIGTWYIQGPEFHTQFGGGINFLFAQTDCRTGNAALGVWHHACATWTPTTGNLTGYLDGSVQCYSPTKTYFTGDGYPYLTIGAGVSLYGFNGSIDEVRIWNYSMNASQVAEQYKLNFAKYSPIAFNFNASENLTTASHDYEYRLLAGNVTGETDTLYQYVTTTQPIPVTTCDANGSWMQSNRTVTLNSSTADWTMHWVNDNNPSNATIFPINSQGNNSITFYSHNAGGNEANKTCFAPVDWTAPTTTTNASSTWVRWPTFYVNSTDVGGSNVRATTCWPNGDAPVNTTIITAPAGNNTYICAAFDKAGNQETNKTFHHAYDGTAPTTTNNVTGTWLKTNATVALNGSDATSGVMFTTHWVNGGAGSNLTLFSLSTEGNNTLKFFSADNAGNQEANKTNYIAIDGTAPAIAFLNPTPANYSFNNTFTLNATIYEATSGTASINFTFNGTTAALLNDSLLLAYNFDNNSAIGDNATVAVDVSKYNNNGTLFNDATWTQNGVWGGAMTFDGVDDYVLQPQIDIPNAQPWTFSVWLYKPTGSTTVWQGFIGEAPGASYGDMGRGYFAFHNVLFFYKHYSPSTYYTFGSISLGTTVPYDQWFNIVVTSVPYNATWATLTAYLNGGAVTQSKTIDSSGFRFRYLGKGDVDRNFMGSMDEVRIWNRSLSAAEINTMYYSNLARLNASAWLFGANLSSVPTANYSFALSAVDVAGNQQSVPRNQYYGSNDLIFYSFSESYVNESAQNLLVNITAQFGIVHVSHVIFATNQSGLWVNDTPQLVNSSSSNVTFTWINDSYAHSMVYYQVYANGTLGESNTSGVRSFVFTQEYGVVLSAPANNSVVSNPFILSLTATGAGMSSNCTYALDLQNFSFGVVSNGSLSSTTISTSTGLHNLSVTCQNIRGASVSPAIQSGIVQFYVQVYTGSGSGGGGGGGYFPQATPTPSPSPTPTPSLEPLTPIVAPPVYASCNGDLLNTCTLGNAWAWYDYQSRLYWGVFPISFFLMVIYGMLALCGFWLAKVQASATEYSTPWLIISSVLLSLTVMQFLVYGSVILHAPIG